MSRHVERLERLVDLVSTGGEAKLGTCGEAKLCTCGQAKLGTGLHAVNEHKVECCGL